MRWTRALAFLTILAGVSLAVSIGPRLPVSPTPASVEVPGLARAASWLADREAGTPALVPGAEARIRWAGEEGLRTPLAIVWLHGFSASPPEVSPLFEKVAGDLGANLYMARLTGHGQDGAALGAATAAQWQRDAAEALALGAVLGERVVLAGGSTGGTLALLAASAAENSPAGLVLLAPNLLLASPTGRVLTWPWARQVLPIILGAERGFAPLNEDHARLWTERYPLSALFEMAAVTQAARALDPGAQHVPLLVLAAEADRVVSTAAARDLALSWGGPARMEMRRLGPGDDPLAHVLAGDILSPAQTEPMARLIGAWIAQLP
ncbi:MAG: alpha/beta fold hydrolase [Rhodobacteraceae bacterium]|nr:alpha/beta fold hydrolase [Paracoccaceae bacterium]